MQEAPPAQVAEDVGPYLALPLGELSAQPTERVRRGVGSAPPEPAPINSLFHKPTIIKRGIIMEETRSFGYICPKCGRAVMARRSAFSLAAAAAHIECPCGQSDMLIETDGSRFRLWVPCGLCGETHQAECSADAVLRGRGIGLACPKTRQICCYVGQEDQVSAQMEQLAVRAAKEKAEDPEAFTDNIIMYEVLSELKDIAARGGIRCRCGSTRYGIQVHRDSVDLCCQDCGGKLRLPAATDEDLDRLCCQMTLTIPGRA